MKFSRVPHIPNDWNGDLEGIVWDILDSTGVWYNHILDTNGQGYRHRLGPRVSFSNATPLPPIGTAQWVHHLCIQIGYKGKIFIF